MPSTSKQQLRRILTTRLSLLSEREKSTKSSKICTQLISSIDWSQVSSAHCYKPIARLSEVDTGAIIDYIRTSQPHIALELVEDSADAPQPAKLYDLVIVPLLGYDEYGNRLGRGAGWYDQFLAGQPRARIIGLAFSEQKCSVIPTEPHDVKIEQVLSA